MNDIFISYSARDSVFAFRIYRDLHRSGLESGLKVYLFEDNRDSGVDFEKEIHSMIDQSHTICLIDSPNARKSQWVKKECEYAISSGKRIIPCIIAKQGGVHFKLSFWRFLIAFEKQGDWFSKDLLFPNQTTVRAIDFSHLDDKEGSHLDNKEEYKRAIISLCKTLKVDFKPKSKVPQARDFEKEIARLKLPDEVKQFLINDYENFYSAHLFGLSTQKSRIENLMQDCKKYCEKHETNKKSILICHLALGEIYADNNEDSKALKVFEEACKEFPDDARPWAAISAAHFYLSNYQESLEAIENSIQIIEKNPDSEYLQQHKDEMLYNKIQILIQLQQFDEVYSLLNQDHIDLSKPEYLSAKIILALQFNHNFSSEYQKLSKKYYSFNLNPNQLNRIIGDLESRLGQFYVNSNIEKSLHHFDIARKAQPTNIQYHADYFLVKKSINKLTVPEMRNVLKSLNPQTDVEYYYYGLIHFLSNNNTESRYYYEKSKMYQWGYYN
ncbi:MAG: TIR domain-containing protein [Bacteroidetes bacterium]|nr:TIR domain-containing protein [Bacteroidota bacterium]